MHFALVSSVLSLLLLNASPVLAASANDAKAAFAVRPEQHIILGFPKKAQRNSPIFVTFSENKDPKLFPGLQYNASLSVFSPSGEMLQSNLPAGAATVDAFSETGCLNRPGNGTVSDISFDTVGIYSFQWTFTYATPSVPSKDLKTSCGTGPFSTETMTLKFSVNSVESLNPTDPNGWPTRTMSDLAAQPTGMVEDVDTRFTVRASGTAGADSRPDSTGIPGAKGSPRNAAGRTLSGGLIYVSLVVAAFALVQVYWLTLAICYAWRISSIPC